MRPRSHLLAGVVSLIAVSHTLSAQPRATARFNGAWQQVELRSQRPDSTVTRPGSSGMRIVYNGHFTQIFYPATGQPSSRPATANEKAARYDAVTANAGHFEVTDDSTWVVHFDFAKGPASIGTSVTAHYRISGDTLWETTIAPWSKDSTKVVRTTGKYVRMK